MQVDCDRLDLKNKKAGIYGVGGATGRSVINFLSKLGNQLLLYDDQNWQKLEPKTGIKVNNKDDLLNADYIVTSPGVSLQQNFFARAKKRKLLVISEIELAYNFFERFLIAITGTNGKTTTTSLVGEILSKGLKDSHVKIAGNIGTPLLKTMINSDKDDIIVAEVSSFQLAGIKNFAPDIAVNLNFSPDHLDWHKNLDNYRESKQKIFINQTKSQLAVINGDDSDIIQMAEKTSAKIKRVTSKDRPADIIIADDIFIEDEKVIREDSLEARGTHNLKNIAFAVYIGKKLGVSTEIIENVVRNFTPPPHRMQTIKKYRGLRFIDDSKATNPHAACAALDSLEKNSKIVIVAGGQDRKLDLSDFSRKIRQRALGAVLLGETAQSLKTNLVQHDFYNAKIVKNMEQAVRSGIEMLDGEGTLILTPGAPSWDMYESYKERGEFFREAVEMALEDIN